MTWLLQFWTWKTKAGLFAALLIVAVWWHKHEMTKAYERGAVEKQESLLKDEGQRIETAIADERTEMAAERSEIEKQRITLSAEQKALQGHRRDILEVLNRGTSGLASRAVEIQNEISNTADIDVDRRYRDAVLRARTADSKLAGLRATQP